MRLLVSHDAGGAEILSSWLRRQPEREDVACVLEGPARRIFARKLGAVRETTLAAGIAAADSLLCGTSWQSTLELDALELARARKVPSASFLDHWVNYRERFQLAGREHLPDELWVGDEHAHAIAKSLFPGVPVRRIDNPYFQDIREAAAAWPKRESSAALRVLYVAEPLSDVGFMPGKPRVSGFDEHDALRHFLASLPALRSPVESVRVRPHPSEPPGKYDWSIGFEGLPVERGGQAPLMEEIAWADAVAGVGSMAMVTSLLSGTRTLSCIPDGSPCVLPFPEIERLG